ncbi:SDR family oxidoreductase [Caballeronia sp. BR00000012568055]|uniref:SDR family oxidoreductase n=1 Tax=Caballeronia sp. BR00000012568055 TaxID=2918761 RepID=UPI0023F900B2|nr:SDR family oxidoreductase [Caballeronia sp. BR00000012568055]
MKIVVMGGSGLIGAKLVTLLRAKGHDALAASTRTGVNAITGEGLQVALKGADVVIDVTNAPSWNPDDVMAFFRDATINLMKAEAEAGVKHHVVLSIVGTDLMTDNFYFRAKTAQEKLIEESGVPYTIVRATQFFEFISGIADVNTVDGTVRIPPGLFQPIAADDVTDLIADIALHAPANGIVDIAGPTRAPFAEIVATTLRAQGDAREVVTDPHAKYFGGTVVQTSLVPVGEARIGQTSLDDWLERVSA